MKNCVWGGGGGGSGEGGGQRNAIHPFPEGWGAGVREVALYSPNGFLHD